MWQTSTFWPAVECVRVECVEPTWLELETWVELETCVEVTCECPFAFAWAALFP